MAVTLVRATVLYAVVIFLIRVMGKRQIGELQPAEFVVTMLVSEIASIPMQDNTIPILNSISALFVLVAYEVITSAVSLKSYKFRAFMQGHPIIVIRDGVIDIKALKKMRMSVNDLMGALRQKDVFEISQVSYAIFETNGQISVLLKPENMNATAGDLNLRPQDEGMPFAVICDGTVIEDAVEQSGIERSKIKSAVSSAGMEISEVLIMTVTPHGKTYIVRKGDEN
ncbi:MAG: DUF421 domain-containing protein [Clostridium sp.]|nr:DUF421 domain-containing protein [Clostridium sp.]MDY5896075.1 DUF421 domain-containing protein [Oscillospiraceae bacterium]CDC12738.1 putative uncharacterized protein [Clostridium sp. CAG:413]